MSKYSLEEGDECPSCRDGKLEFIVPENCGCLNNPPCEACVSAPLTCTHCGDEFDGTD